jgi:outer membrane receptor for ferrienterochelin and colicins
MKTLIHKAFVLVFLLLVGTVHAQGTLKGVITDASNGETLIGANILVSSVDASVSKGTVTNVEGKFEISGLLAGRYYARISYVGFTDQRITDIIIVNGQATELNISLSPGMSLNPVVVSASKIREKVTESPSSIQVISAQQIKNITTTSSADFIKGAAGVDVAQQGVASSTVVARGFNNIFSGSLLLMTDNRIATVPSLRANLMHFIPLVNEDIESIEVVLGPGAALYGPNANSGVVNILTKSPLVAQGTTIGVYGGNQSMLKAQFRTAHKFSNKLGLKLSGSYLSAEEYKLASDNKYLLDEQANRTAYLARPANQQNPAIANRIGIRDYGIEKFGFDARVDINPGEDMDIILNYGLNNSNNIDLTGLGAGQAVNWSYSYYQGRFIYKNFFAQAFLNKSNSGDTYIIPTGLAIVDKSSQFVTQIQHQSNLGKLNLLYGFDYLSTNPVTDGTINGRNEDTDGFYEVGGYLQSKFSATPKLDFLFSFRADKHEKLKDPQFSPRAAMVVRPIENNNFRFTFNRSFSTPSSNALFLDLLAGSSPVFAGYNAGAGVLNVFAQGVPQTGFTFPRTSTGAPIWQSNLLPRSVGTNLPFNAMNIDAANWSVIRQLAAAGVPAQLAPALLNAPAPGTNGLPSVGIRMMNPLTGLQVADVNDIDPIKSTTYNTFEVGYKGIFNERFLVNADLYFTKAQDFTGPLIVESPTVNLNPTQLGAYFGTYLTQLGLPAQQVQQLATGLTQSLARVPMGVVSPNEAFERNAVMLTYRNFGEINYFGMDFNFEYLLNDRYSLSGNYSYVSKDKWLELDDNPDFNIFLNAPQNKFALGMRYDNRKSGLDYGVKFRYIDGFPIQSGIYSTYNATTGVHDLIDSYYSLDVNMGYNFTKSIRGSFNVNNLTNNKKPQFAGTPDIGLFAVGGVSVSF